MGRRTPKEELVDHLLLLYQTRDAFRYVSSLPKTKLQKLVYLAEKSMLDKHEKGFNYNYIRLNVGPYSPELESDRKKFVKLSLVDRSHQPTSFALAILEDFGGLFKRNSVFVKKIEGVNKKYAEIPLRQLLDLVYDMPHPYLKPQIRIRDVKLRTPMLYRIPQEKAIKSFQIRDDEVEDLGMCLDPETFDSMRRAMNDMRAKRLRSHKEVFGRV